MPSRTFVERFANTLGVGPAIFAFAIVALGIENVVCAHAFASRNPGLLHPRFMAFSNTEKQFVILNGFITPAMAQKRKVEPTGEDNGRAHSDFFEGLVNKASLQELGAWLVELALIHHRDHAPYCHYGDGPGPDPLFDTATRWGLDVDAIKATMSEQPKPKRKAKATSD